MLLILASTAALGQYRCVENGKTVFTDQACAGSSPARTGDSAPVKVVGNNGNAAYATPSGAWRGQAQFQATISGAEVNDAHAVVPLTLEIDPKGKVRGISSENGCKFLGISSPGMVPTMINLDVTLTECRYAGFNRRMFGFLTVYQAQQHAQLTLNRLPTALTVTHGTYDIRATLRR